MTDLLLWSVTTASIIGTVANIYRQRWGFGVWIVTNAIWCGYDYWLGIWSQSALMAVYFALACIGWWRWGRKA